MSTEENFITRISHCIHFFSKTDENTEADRLGFLLPAHEYFHQSMVVADCESELVRDAYFFRMGKEWLSIPKGME